MQLPEGLLLLLLFYGLPSLIERTLFTQAKMKRCACMCLPVLHTWWTGRGPLLLPVEMAVKQTCAEIILELGGITVSAFAPSSLYIISLSSLVICCDACARLTASAAAVGQQEKSKERREVLETHLSQSPIYHVKTHVDKDAFLRKNCKDRGLQIFFYTARFGAV